MADTSKDVKIGIVTTADTSGVDKTVTAINQLTGVERERGLTQADLLTASERERAEIDRLVTSAQRHAAATEEQTRAELAAADAARKEQAALDALEAKRRLATRAAKDNTDSTARLGMVVQQVGYQATDFATQVSMGTSAMVAFAQQAPQAIGAITQFGNGIKFSLSSAVSLGTAVGVITTAIAVSGNVIAGEYAKIQAEEKKLKESQEAVLTARKNLIEATRTHIQQVRSSFIAQTFKTEADELEREAAALERIQQLRAAQSGAAEAQAAAAVAAAQSGGGDVTGAKSNQIQVGVNSQLGQLQAKIEQSDAAITAAALAFEKANSAYAEASSRPYAALTEGFDEISAAYDAAKQKLEEAKAERLNLDGIIAAEKQKIEANAQASLSGLSDEVTKGIDEKTKEFVDGAIANINAVAAERGPKLAADARGAMDRFQNLINDTIPDSQQLDQITTTVRQFRGSQSTMLAGLVENFDALLKEAGGLASEVERQKNELQRLKGFISQITGFEL